MLQLVVCKILGLERGKECIIVGTLFKHMKLKPKILEEYSMRSAVPLVKPHNFVHPDDSLVLEDDSGRVNLGGALLSPSAYATETEAGEFLVEDVLEAGLPPQLKLPLRPAEDKYVVLVSGLSVGSSACKPLLYHLLVDHITVHLGDKQIPAALSVDIMPGPDDPANFALPQQNDHSFRFLVTSGQNIDDLENHSEAKDRLEFMERTLRWRHLAPTAPNTLGCYPYTDRDPFLIEACPHVCFAGNQDKYGTRTMKGQEGQFARLISVPKFCETGVAVTVGYLQGKKLLLVEKICLLTYGIFLHLNLRNLECHFLSFGASV